MKHIAESPLLKALDALGKSSRDVVYVEAEKFEALLQNSARMPQLEAVPPDMMELFTDQQWPQLVFQFQPSLRLFEGVNDVVSLRQQAESSIRLDLTAQGEQYHWLVFCRQQEQLIRSARPREYQGLQRARAGENFGAVATALWPEEKQGEGYRRMTDMLLEWLTEGLIIDAGVPLPADARFESEPDAATRSYASSPGPGSENQ